MSAEYRALYDRILEFCRRIVSTSAGSRRRVRFWAVVSILRCVLSSPAAAEATLRAKADRLRLQKPSNASKFGHFYRLRHRTNAHIIRELHKHAVCE